MTLLMSVGSVWCIYQFHDLHKQLWYKARYCLVWLTLFMRSGISFAFLAINTVIIILLSMELIETKSFSLRDVIIWNLQQSLYQHTVFTLLNFFFVIKLHPRSWAWIWSAIKSTLLLIDALFLIIVRFHHNTIKYIAALKKYNNGKLDLTYRWYPAKRALPAMLTHGR